MARLEPRGQLRRMIVACGPPIVIFSKNKRNRHCFHDRSRKDFLISCLRSLPFCRHTPTTKILNPVSQVIDSRFFGLLFFRFCVFLAFQTFCPNLDLLNPASRLENYFLKSDFVFHNLFSSPSLPLPHTHHATTHHSHSHSHTERSNFDSHKVATCVVI